MVKYECKICQFENVNKNKYMRHISTQKHKLKVKQVDNDKKGENDGSLEDPIRIQKRAKKRAFLCSFCNSEFSGSNNLARHKKICMERTNIIKLYENKLQNKDLEHKLDEMQIKLDSIERERDTYKYIVNQSGGLIKKSLSSLSYLIKNHNTAPALQTIEADIISYRKIVYDEKTGEGVIEDIDSDESVDMDKLGSDIITAYKHKTLNKYLGGCIIDNYKKDEPSTQSVWNTDTNRLTYVIRELINNKSTATAWYIDKNGVRTRTYLIDPILKEVKAIIIKYQLNKNDNLFSYKGSELELMMENISAVTHLVTEIEDGTIAIGLLRYLAPHLKINTQLLE